MPEKADFDALTEEARLRNVHILVAITPDGLIVADRVEAELVDRHPELAYHITLDELITLLARLRDERMGKWFNRLQLTGQRSADPDGQRDPDQDHD